MAKQRCTLLLMILGLYVACSCVGKRVTLNDPELILADGIASVVQGPEGAHVITKSDLLKPGIDGQIREIDDLEREYQMFQDACRLKVADPKDEDSIDAYLRQIQSSNGLSDKDIEDIFKQSGRTIAEGRGELQRMQAVGQIINFKVHRNVLVTPSEVESYCLEHPEYEDAFYAFRIAYISKNEPSFEKMPFEPIEFDALEPEIHWSSKLTLTDNELAEHLRFITALRSGTVKAVEYGNELLVAHLIEGHPRRKRVIKERYPEVENLLRQQKYPELFANYQKELDQMFIVTRLDT